jgi:hypothetical protein
MLTGTQLLGFLLWGGFTFGAGWLMGEYFTERRFLNQRR